MGALRAHQADVTRYLYSYIAFAAAATAGTIEPDSLQVADDSDGSYAAFFLRPLRRSHARNPEDGLQASFGR